MRHIVVLLFGALFLAACVTTSAPQGGGAPLAAVPTSGVGGLLNAQRAANGLGPVVPNAQLAAAAHGHAQDMVQRGYFAHEAPNGATPAARAQAQGYCYRSIAENIASGQPSIEAVVSAWMGSPSHRRNILSRNAREFGLGRVGTMWVLVLGSSC
ncbi:MAG: CAP domain-containing protein [Octadecabacter sp.]